MSDWSDRALERTEKRQETQQIRDQVWLEKQRLIKSNGAPLWHEVKAIIKKHISDFNEKSKMERLFFDVTQNAELRVRSEIEDHRQYLQAFFDEGTGRLKYECGARRRNGWELRIVDGKVGFYQGVGEVPISPESIAEQMLDALIE
jgi:gas vesicle protein